ncbi:MULTISPECIES: DNA polymerase III subunit gamma/tau [Paenibacillus]|uniref:DNA-directed DNA polymerase n=1 Tax=Paenibacillus campinasensis TaxID=66347 RepID=A0A268EDK6_9BACL|nr:MULTISPECIES: DNA polymerase III subunit gamma/tau [Paenibacillus]MUG68884.1 DNA polymerase III subunit gamma/tau [Paenibacillus campinasensis]PAD71203.1 DNA polymerase III subunit gamma/tau [Paenibacillus campinasensis]PAK47750.1 DNA polymerase III subunit gamma/tau [Paenibacillus sp. 7541]
MEHIALYRAWRPQSFRDMVGQQHIIQTLQNAIREQRVSHAYLFSGPRGTGKTSAAKIMAKAVNCEAGPAEEPCNDCEACRRITAGAVMDVQEIDAASNRGVEEIRDLREKVKYAPTEVRRKVYIIDEVHMLTTEAFNALLKTLEEPPAHVMFILATTEPHKLPATIISRCQRFDFRRVSLDEQTGRLQRICEEEGIQAEPEALSYIARLSDGGMRDALSILDQIASYTGGSVSYEQVMNMTGGIASEQFGRLASALKQGDAGAVLQIVEQFMQEGKSADKCMENLLYYFRDLLMIKMVPNADKLTDRVLNPAEFEEMAAAFTQAQLFQMIDTLNRYQSEMKYASQPQTLFEVALLKLSGITQGSGESGAAGHAAAGADAGEVAKLKQQVAQLERKLERLIQQGPVAGAGGREAAKPARTPAPKLSSTAKIPPNINQYVAASSSEAFTAVQRQWAQILQSVKDEKVTVHAWLMDGEPVSVWEDQVLIAFKNNIHRETTERPANKQVIEGVLERILGKPHRLITMMHRDWSDVLEGEGKPKAEELTLEHEASEAEGEKPWIDEAIQLFGEDLVVIKD